MQATLIFNLPEDECELRAALDSMDHIGSIRDFQERLRAMHKYGHGFKTADEAIECLYNDYCEAMQAYL